MRTIHDHQVNPTNDTLTVTVVDSPGPGGAHHAYFISGADWSANPGGAETLRFARVHGAEGMALLFQNGPITETGVNGLTHEVLLAVLSDRLKCFQNGPFANAYNALALSHIEQAQEALQARTKARMTRGVEGTHTI